MLGGLSNDRKAPRLNLIDQFSSIDFRISHIYKELTYKERASSYIRRYLKYPVQHS